MSHDYYTCMHYDCAACLARETSERRAHTAEPVPPVCVDVVAKRSWREAFAWACCIAFVGGMVAAHILTAW